MMAKQLEGEPYTKGEREGGRDEKIREINQGPYFTQGFPGGTSGKEPTCQCRRCRRCGFHLWVGEGPLEKGTATHSSILAWRIPWIEKPGELHAMTQHASSYHGGGLVPKLCLILATPWTVAHQVPLFIGFFRQEYQSELPFSFPGDLPDPGIEPRSPGLKADALLTEPPGEALIIIYKVNSKWIIDLYVKL